MKKISQGTLYKIKKTGQIARADEETRLLLSFNSTSLNHLMHLKEKLCVLLCSCLIRFVPKT